MSALTENQSAIIRSTPAESIKKPAVWVFPPNHPIIRFAPLYPKKNLPASFASSGYAASTSRKKR